MVRIALQLAALASVALAGDECSVRGGPECAAVGGQLLQVARNQQDLKDNLLEYETGTCEDARPKKCGSAICSKQWFQSNCKKTCGLCSETPTSAPGPSPRPQPTSAPGPRPAPNSEKPTVPTPINTDNKGRCYTDESRLPTNVKWYTWWIGEEQRCTSVYIPPEASKPMPVTLGMDCYGNDRKAAGEFGRFPVANFVLSTPFEDHGGKGGWRTGNDGVVNDGMPQACSDDDTPEMPYLKAIFQIIEDDPETFDASKIYTYGFSQNSIFSAYVGFCFSDKVAGIVQTGSGLVVASEGGRPPPNSGGYCKYSDYNEYGRDCRKSHACTDCEYWPIYPCYEPRPVVHCGFIYEDDFMGHTMQAMYDRAVAEGYDARLFEVAGGSHKEFRNKEEWYAGCLGITEACTSACAADVKSCIKASQRDGDKAYFDCTSGDLPSSCSAGCSPTQEMLVLSESPKSVQLSTGAFGAPQSSKSRPSSSKCVHQR